MTEASRPPFFGNANRVLAIVGGIFLLIGVIQASVGAFFYFRQQSFIARAETAQGEVLGLDRRSGRDNSGSSYAGIIAFTDKAGRRREFTETVSSNPPRFSAGDRVQVLYEPDNPASAIVDDWFSRWFMSAIFGGIGSILTIVGAALLIVRRRRAAKAPAQRTPTVERMRQAP